jgi:3-deoxy-D-manno-octulosonate 8-phosphate phosphatase (KDO 8-P phosphatase)
MNTLEKFSLVKAFVFDVDGVLTDGTLTLINHGIQARKMNIKDGLALQMAIKNGFPVKVISGADSLEVYERLYNLGIKEVEIGVKDKVAAVESFLKKHKLTYADLLFMGDDLPDLELLKLVGLPCCPADAVQEVKEAAVYHSPLAGGQACVREVIEKVLKLQDKWIWTKEVSSR